MRTSTTACSEVDFTYYTTLFVSTCIMGASHNYCCHFWNSSAAVVYISRGKPKTNNFSISLLNTLISGPTLSPSLPFCFPSHFAVSRPLHARCNMRGWSASQTGFARGRANADEGYGDFDGDRYGCLCNQRFQDATI